eukprot:scaffold214723_cov35-Tisochrysis_lutea.AAC.2
MKEEGFSPVNTAFGGTSCAWQYRAGTATLAWERMLARSRPASAGARGGRAQAHSSSAPP